MHLFNVSIINFDIWYVTGSQNLGYVLYDMHDRGDIQKDFLPISKESTLKWLGFSEEGVSFILIYCSS